MVVRRDWSFAAVTSSGAREVLLALGCVYVIIWQKTVLIPWTEFKGIGEATLYWQKVPMLTIGDPPVTTMTVPVAVFQMMRERLPTGLTGA